MQKNKKSDPVVRWINKPPPEAFSKIATALGRIQARLIVSANKMTGGRNLASEF